MARQSEDITVYAGTFASQPLVFAHLWDAAPDLDLDHVDVICRVDPAPRLRHYFAPDVVGQIGDALGLHTTVVLFMSRAGDLAETEALTRIGTFAGSRVVP